MTIEVVFPYCCGLDVHKRFVTACVLTPTQQETREFSTMTADLLALGQWLQGHEVTHVAMESTGVYWQPVWNLLEDAFTLLLVNAQHMKAVPGRKTDVADAAWIAELLRHGLLRGSFVPSRAEREQRALVRYRTRLVQERSAEINRLQKTLEGANLKLASVVSDIMGVSARAMLEALLAGEHEPAVLAELAKGRLRSKRAELAQALTGRLDEPQRFLVSQQLVHIDFLDEQITRVSAEIDQRLPPQADALARLDTIPGVNRWTAEVILSEIGSDLSRFPSAAHLASWAGICPGNHASGGKRQSGRARKGNRWLKAGLAEAGFAAGHGKATALAAQYRRIARRRGKKRATLAVGHAILVIAYHLLTTGQDYQELGADYLQDRQGQTRAQRLVHALERMGHTVTLTPRTEETTAPVTAGTAGFSP
ncbi:MAG TPA: IS110 family transposase [Trueperaceae bacterium]